MKPEKTIMTNVELIQEPKTRHYIFDLNFKLFVASGFGYLENPKQWQKFLYFLYHFSIHFSYVFHIIFFFVDLHLVKDDKEKLNLNLTVTIVTTGSVFKMWALMVKMKNLREIRKNFKEDLGFDFGDNKKAQSVKKVTADLQKKVTTLFYLLAAMASLIWVTFPLVDPNAKERRFCIPFPLVQDKSSPKFEMIYTYHALLFFQFVYNIISNEMLLIGFLMRICDQFDILKINLEGIKDLYPKVDFGIFGYKDKKKEKGKKTVGDSDKRKCETRKLMRENIIHHKRILELFDLVSDTYGDQLFVNITAGAILISVVAYTVILQSSKFNAVLIQQLIYVVGVTSDIFIMCYLGTQIQIKSEEVVQTLYDLPWYSMDKNNQKTLMIMINKCRKPPNLKARYFFKVNLDTYQSLMKTSYNVIAVLNEAK